MTPEVKAVKRGAKLLDTYVPNWARKINLTKFDITDTDRCVLGQVHGDFTRGLQKLVATVLVPKLPNVQLNGGESLTKVVETMELELDAPHYGFAALTAREGLTDVKENQSFERLGQQWIREIRRRRAA